MKKVNIAVNVVLALMFFPTFISSPFAGSKQIATPSCIDDCNFLCAPPAAGSYSQAIELGGIVYLAGQIAMNPCIYNDDDSFAKEIVGPSNIALQTERVMQNLGAVLNAAGLEFKDVLSTTVYLKDIGDFSKFDKVYGMYFACKKRNDRCVELSVDPSEVFCCDDEDPYCGRNCGRGHTAYAPPARATIGGTDIPLNTSGAILEVSMIAGSQDTERKKNY